MSLAIAMAIAFGTLFLLVVLFVVFRRPEREATQSELDREWNATK